MTQGPESGTAARSPAPQPAVLWPLLPVRPPPAPTPNIPVWSRVCALPEAPPFPAVPAPHFSLLEPHGAGANAVAPMTSSVSALANASSLPAFHVLVPGTAPCPDVAKRGFPIRGSVHGPVPLMTPRPHLFTLYNSRAWPAARSLSTSSCGHPRRPTRVRFPQQTRGLARLQ